MKAKLRCKHVNIKPSLRVNAYRINSFFWNSLSIEHSEKMLDLTPFARKIDDVNFHSQTYRINLELYLVRKIRGFLQKYPFADQNQVLIKRNRDSK